MSRVPFALNAMQAGAHWLRPFPQELVSEVGERLDDTMIFDYR